MVAGLRRPPITALEDTKTVIGGLSEPGEEAALVVNDSYEAARLMSDGVWVSMIVR